MLWAVRDAPLAPVGLPTNRRWLYFLSRLSQCVTAIIVRRAKAFYTRNISVVSQEARNE